MHIKHFTMFLQRVPNPMHPNRPVSQGKLAASGTTSLSHDGVTYEPDENGWFDVPHEVGVELCKFRVSGSGFFQPHEVADAVRLGSLDEPDVPAEQKPKAEKKPAAKKDDDPKD